MEYKGRNKACGIINQIMNRRRSVGRKQHSDVLGILMDVKIDDKTLLSNGELQDNILTLLFAAHDTSAAALTWTLKNLTENVRLLNDLTVCITELFF